MSVERFDLYAADHDVWMSQHDDGEYVRFTDYDTLRQQLAAALAERDRDAARLDYIERTFSGVTNRERYLPVAMVWGSGAMGRTLREACDKYMSREAAIAAGGEETA